MCYFDGHIRNLGEVSPPVLDSLTTKVLSQQTQQLWDIEDKNKPNRFQALKAAKHIVFQFPDDINLHTASSYKPLWDEWKGVLQPAIEDATRIYNFKKGKTARIMLANLQQGGTIMMHVDQNRSADVPHKIHIPIQTAEGAEFYEDKACYFLEKGCSYEVNNKIPHGVRNLSNVDRIHLIFDYYESAV